jgi:biopolymer transport protein ExbD
MAPMIDIVFLLLVFFMCTSSFNENESQLPAQVPQASAQGRRLIEDFDPVRITLRAAGSGVEVQCDGQRCAGFDALLAKLQARRAIADVPVIIEGQKGVPFGPMVAAMDTCYRANFRRVAFSARGVGDAER